MKNTQQPVEIEFDVIFETYKNQIYGYVFTLVKSPYYAEELTQEILIKLWLCQEMLQEITNLEGYIYTIARNKALNHLRKAAYDVKLLNELKTFMPESHNNSEVRINLMDYERLVGEAVEKLTPQRKKVYLMSREEGLNHAEIAEQLHLSKNTIKNHLVESLKAIRDHLKENDAMILLLSYFMLI